MTLLSIQRTCAINVLLLFTSHAQVQLLCCIITLLVLYISSKDFDKGGHL